MSSFTVGELRKKLADAGLPIDGSAGVLVARYNEHLEKARKAGDAEEETKPAKKKAKKEPEPQTEGRPKRAAASKKSYKDKEESDEEEEEEDTKSKKKVTAKRGAAKKKKEADAEETEKKDDKQPAKEDQGKKDDVALSMDLDYLAEKRNNLRADQSYVNTVKVFGTEEVKQYSNFLPGLRDPEAQYSQVVIIEGFDIGDNKFYPESEPGIKSFDAVIRAKFGLKHPIRYIGTILTLKNKKGNGGREDFLFVVHREDSGALGTAERFKYNIRWFDDVLANGNSSCYLRQFLKDYKM